MGLWKYAVFLVEKYIGVLVQDCGISSALPVEIHVLQ